jgi:predicted aspartyl protease
MFRRALARRCVGLAAGALLAVLGPGTRGEAACQLLQVGELQVTMLGNTPLIPASIDGHAVQMLVDTGAAKSMIWRSKAQELGLHMSSSRMKFYGAGGADEAGVVLVHDLGLASGTAHGVLLYAAGRGKPFANSAGILGEDVLSRWDLEFDLSAGKIRLFKPKNCEGDQVAYWATAYYMAKLVISAAGTNWLEANVSLDGHQIVALFDTGAALSTVSSKALVQTGVKAEAAPVAAEVTRGLANRPIETTVAVFPTLTIGQESIENAKLRIADLFSANTEKKTGSLVPRSVMASPDLLIGADFFMAHRIYVARSQGKIYFTYKGGQIFQQRIPSGTAPPAEGDAGDSYSRHGG